MTFITTLLTVICLTASVITLDYKISNAVVENIIVKDNADLHIRNKRAAFMSEQSKQILVDAHNEFRRLEQYATDMTEMVWDEELASMAEHWSNRCVFLHGNRPLAKSSPFYEVGQNLFISTTNYVNLRFMIKVFYNEKRYYNMNKLTCEADQKCGHYTQVVWAKTTAVGCAWKICDSIGEGEDGIHRGMFLTCNYGEAGNHIRTSPYTVSRTLGKCSACPEGHNFCDNELCVNSCEGRSSNCHCNKVCHNCGTLDADTCTCKCAPGFGGAVCLDVCGDNSEHCGVEWPVSYCTSDVKSSRIVTNRYCKKLCNHCNKADSNFICGRATTPPTTIITTTTVASTTTQIMTENERCAYMKSHNTCKPGGYLYKYRSNHRQYPNHCKCMCYRQFKGNHCDDKDESIQGVISYTKYAYIKNEDTPEFNSELQKQKNLAMTYFNRKCAADVQMCCIGSSSGRYFERFPFMSKTEKIISQPGYPLSSTKRGRDITYFKFVGLSEGSGMCAKAKRHSEKIESTNDDRK